MTDCYQKQVTLLEHEHSSVQFKELDPKLPQESEILGNIDNTQTKTVYNVQGTHGEDLINKLRFVDFKNAQGRERRLMTKIASTQSEVSDILSVDALNDFESLLNQISNKIINLTDEGLVGRILADNNKKSSTVCVKLELKNQYKLNRLISFIGDLQAFESDETEEIDEIDMDGSSIGDDDIPNEEFFQSTNSRDKVKDAGDMIKTSMEALNICRVGVKNSEKLASQFKILSEFFQEFKGHIYK